MTGPARLLITDRTVSGSPAAFDLTIVLDPCDPRLGDGTSRFRLWGGYRTRSEGFRALCGETARCWQEWGALRVEGGVLRDLFLHDQRSVWDMVEPDFFWKVLYLLDDVRTCSRILEIERPGSVVVETSHPRLRRVVKAVCEAKGIPLSETTELSPGRRFREWLESRTVTRHVIIAGRPRAMRAPRGALSAIQTLRSVLRTVRSRAANGRGPVDVVHLLAGRDSGVGPEGVASLLRLGLAAGHRIAVVDWTFSGARLRVRQAKGIATGSLEAGANPGTLLRVARARQRFRREWRRVANGPALDALTYRGVSVRTLVEPELNELVNWCMPAAVEFYELATQMLRRFRPSVVVMPDKHVRSGRAIALACRSHGTPTVGLPGNAAMYMDREPTGEPVQLVDYKLTDGPAISEWLVECGCPAQRVLATGNPYMDMVLQARPQPRADVAPGTILVITSPATEVNRLEDKVRFVREVVAAANARPDRTFIIKLHPAERGTVETDAAAETANIQLVRDRPLYELLHEAAVVVFTNSTVGHEAVALDKPLVQVNLSSSETDVIPAAESGAAVAVREPGTLATAIDTVLTDASVQASLRRGRAHYVKRFMCALDGRAAERITNVIDALLGRRDPCEAMSPTDLGATTPLATTP